jgi:hypothetical protein
MRVMRQSPDPLARMHTMTEKKGKSGTIDVKALPRRVRRAVPSGTAAIHAQPPRCRRARSGSVHHPAADHGRHIAHAAPRVSRRALEPEIVPGILPAWRIGRHHCESMQHDGEIELGGFGIERLQRRVVERHTDRRIHHCPPGPARLTPTAYLGQRTFYVTGAGQNHPAQPVRQWLCQGNRMAREGGGSRLTG